MDNNIVRTVLNKCLGLKKGEKLLIVTDDVTFPLANDFYATAQKVCQGHDLVIMSMAPRKVHGEEPPAAIREAMKSADAALLMTAKSLSHTKARKEACKKYGVRIASLPSITKDIMYRSITIDYSDLKKRVAYYINKFENGKRAYVTTPKGTELSFSIAGRKGFRDDGLYNLKGAFGNLPAGEAAVAPVEKTCNGRLVVDGSAPFIGKLKKPVEIIIKNGYAVNIPFPSIKKLISGLGRNAYNIAEFGIGLNPKAKVTGVILEDEKVLRTGHLAIGNNESFGGHVYCPLHLDFVFYDPSLFIDGEEIKWQKHI